MPEELNLKTILEDVVASYEDKINNVSSIFDAGGFFLDGSQGEKMSRELRDVLSRNENLRKKDFDSMMQDILLTQQQREVEVRDLLRNYFDTQKSMARDLKEGLKEFRNYLAKGEADRVKEFRALIEGILTKQEKRRQEVTSRLKEFQDEQKRLKEALKDLLAKGRDLRIRDLKSMLKKFRNQRDERLALQRKRREEVFEALKASRYR